MPLTSSFYSIDARTFSPRVGAQTLLFTEGRAREMKDWTAIARDKLVRVLGETKGTVVLRDTLRATGLETLGSPDDLHRFAQVLTKQGGFEAAVGGLLSVQAAIAGASGPANPV